jgi:hypothetical protein
MLLLTMAKGFSLRVYIAINFVVAALFINTLLFAPALKMGAAFTAGLSTGIAIAWLIFAISGWIELRKPGRAFDERVQAVFAKACSLGFWVLMLALSLAAALLRSELLAQPPDAKDLAAYASELGLIAFAAAFVILERRS